MFTTVNCPLIKSNNARRNHQARVLFPMADSQKWTLHHVGEQNGWDFSCKVVAYWVGTMGFIKPGQRSALYRPSASPVIWTCGNYIVITGREYSSDMNVLKAAELQYGLCSADSARCVANLLQMPLGTESTSDRQPSHLTPPPPFLMFKTV